MIFITQDRDCFSAGMIRFVVRITYLPRPPPWNCNHFILLSLAKTSKILSLTGALLFLSQLVFHKSSREDLCFILPSYEYHAQSHTLGSCWCFSGHCAFPLPCIVCSWTIGALCETEGKKCYRSPIGSGKAVDSLCEMFYAPKALKR